MRDLRSKLRKCNPYLIERDLLPKLYFKEDVNNTEEWIFKYSFLRKLSDEAIAIRLGFYSRQGINKKLNMILDSNSYLIEEFVAKQ